MKVRALTTVTFGPGARLVLTKEQAASRQHVLTKIADKLYEATALVQFKAGEEFGLHSEMPKSLAAALEPVNSDAKEAR